MLKKISTLGKDNKAKKVKTKIVLNFAKTLNIPRAQFSVLKNSQTHQVT